MAKRYKVKLKADAPYQAAISAGLEFNKREAREMAEGDPLFAAVRANPLLEVKAIRPPRRRKVQSEEAE